MFCDVLSCRKNCQGFFGITTKVPVRDSYSLSLVYTPGVGKSCTEIHNDICKSFELTNRGNSIAIITDGSNLTDNQSVNSLCAIPSVELKSVLYKQFANIDAYPIALNVHNPDDIVEIIRSLTPNFAGFVFEGFLLERSSTIENLLKEGFDFPVLSSSLESKLELILEKLGFTDKISFNVIGPAVFRGALDVQAAQFNDKMLDAVGEALNDAEDSGLFECCSSKYVNLRIAAKIASYVAKAAVDSRVAKVELDAKCVEEKYIAYLTEGKNAWFEKSSLNYLSFEHSLEENSIELHKKARGVIETSSTLEIKNLNDFNSICAKEKIDSIVKEIKEDSSKAYELTAKGNLVAVVSNGTAVLGLGNIGPEAGLPVMEGKAALFKTLAGVDAVPVCLDTKDPDRLIEIVKGISPVFGGINLEDIKAPECFNIEEKLIEALDIPVFHDDQHGTAVVVLAGFLNALKLVGKKAENLKVVVNGAGAGATSVSKLLLQTGIKNLILCDTKGAIYSGRPNGMNYYKELIAKETNPEKIKGELSEVIKGADFFFGLSVGNIVKPEMVKSMASKPVLFALANPVPEIMPHIAYEAGAFVVATGRSDLKNQVNNSLAFPGIFRGALDVRASRINNEMKISAARAIADLINENELNRDYIIPHALDLSVSPNVARAVAETAMKTGVAKIKVNPDKVFERVKNYLYDGFLGEL